MAVSSLLFYRRDPEKKKRGTHPIIVQHIHIYIYMYIFSFNTVYIIHWAYPITVHDDGWVPDLSLK